MENFGPTSPALLYYVFKIYSSNIGKMNAENSESRVFPRVDSKFNELRFLFNLF